MKIRRKTRNAIIEGLKQLIRVALIGIIPVVVAQLQAGTWDWNYILLTGEIAILTGLDKWLHKSEVETPLDLRVMDVLKEKE